MPIEPHDLDSVRDRTSLFAFLRDHLGWRVEPEDTFTYEGPRLHGDVAARAEVSQIVPFSGEDPFTIMLAEFQAPFRRGDLRAILRKIREEIRQAGRYGAGKLDQIVFVCVTEGYGGVRFARFEERAGRQPKLSTFGWDQDDTEGTRTLRTDNLPALRMPINLLGEPDWKQARWDTAWDVEKVTGEFYREYRRIFYELADRIQGIRGDARLFTQRLCNRLLFAQFLAKKGWLYRDRNYLRTLFNAARDCAAKPGVPFEKRANCYSDYLHPLFFKALNTPADARPADAEWSAISERLGDVPFLNGGLFAPQDGDDAPCAVTIPNDAFAPMLDLFDRFNFTLTESTPDDVEVAVDAEMLGKVFEELVNEGDRHDTGSYYTPRRIVSFMCREAIKGYLGGGEAVARFVDEDDPSDIRDPEAVLDALRRVTVCDPACGSGAYLLGMMQELLRLREGLFTRKPKDYQRIYDRKLEIIQRNLYGVDKEPFAVNIAMLRLWLSLVVDNEVPVADVVTGSVDVSLPNLRFKIQQGDSLGAVVADPSLFSNEYSEHANCLQRLHDEYFDPPHSGRTRRAKDLIEADVDAEQVGIADLLGSQAPAGAFDWCVRFAEVFAPSPASSSVVTGPSVGVGFDKDPRSGGFDVVLANPPYGVDVASQYAARVAHKDSYTNFLGLAHALSRLRGMCVYIVPTSWETGERFVSFRRWLFSANKVISVINLPYDVFDTPFVDTCVITFDVGFSTFSSEHIQVATLPKRAQSGLEGIHGYLQPLKTEVVAKDDRLRLVLRPDAIPVLSAVASFPRLDSVARLRRGIESYQYAIRDAPADGSWIRFFVGRVQRYRIEPGTASNFVQIRQIDAGWHAGDRLLIRRLVSRANRLMAARCTDEVVVGKDLYVLKAIGDGAGVNLSFLLGVLNSSLVSYVYLVRSASATKDDFRQVTLEGLRGLPIPPHGTGRDAVCELVEQIEVEVQAGRCAKALEETLDALVYDLFEIPCSSRVEIADYLNARG